MAEIMAVLGPSLFTFFDGGTYFNFFPPHSHFFPTAVFSQARQTHRLSPACTHRFCHALRKSFTGFPSARVGGPHFV
jgi:hypothetical protein